MIVLQTPGTGLDDLESRVALGMCRVALDCVDPEKVMLVEESDRFLVQIHIEENKASDISKSLALWCTRVLGDQTTLLKIPGFRPLHLENQATGVAGFGIKAREQKEILLRYTSNDTRALRKGAHDSVCGHKIKGDKKISDALLALSPHLGKPPKRNSAKSRANLHLCPPCAVFGLLGTNSFQISLQISSVNRKKREYFFFMPRFRGEMNGEDLLAYIVATKHIRHRFQGVPSNSSILALLSCYPHVSRLKMPKTFFVGRGETDGKSWRYQSHKEQTAEAELAFLSHNSYNVALAQDAYQKAEQKSELIGLLSKTLKQNSPSDALSLYREYASMTEGKALVYQESTRYIAKEVLGMDAKLIDDPNVGAVASMLRFFVRKRKFGYVDNLRGSRNPEEFEKHLLSAQRDAASIHAKTDDQKDNIERYLSLPGENQMREFLKLLHGNDNFESVRTLVSLLAFTYWKKED